MSLPSDLFSGVLRSVPGVVAGRLDGDARSFAGFGTLADAVDPGRTTWEIGSITKVFTGTLLAEMAGRGEVSLDDPISRHLPPEVADRLPPDQPRLCDLATHTSGLPRLPKEWLRRMKGSADPYSALTEDDVWAVLGNDTHLPANRAIRYSNYGMGLLGHLLGRAAGSDYPTLLHERIITPLGLEGTGWSERDPVAGYRRRRPTPPWTFGALHGAGALRSTPSDLLTFARAVIEPPPSALGEALQRATRVAHHTRMLRIGLGWQHRITRSPDERRVVWHDGGTYATQAFLAVDLDRRRAVVVLGNRGPVLRVPVAGAGWRLLDHG